MRLKVVRLLSPRPLVSVVYHLVSAAKLPHVSALYSYKTPEAFEQDLLFLKNNYTLVTHEQVVAHREHRVGLPPDATQISFDDGFSECFDVVRPLLLKHQVPCTFFLVQNLLDNRSLMYRHAAACCIERVKSMGEPAVTAACRALSSFGISIAGREELQRWIGSLKWTQKHELDAVCEAVGFDRAAFLRDCRPYLSTEQALQLHRDGFTLGGHTCDHPNLAHLPWEEAAREVVESSRFVADLTGKKHVPFAIPFNGVTLSRNRLDTVRCESGVIDLIYDTNNLRSERNWVVNRVWGDAPGRSNLEKIVRLAHFLEPARELSRRLTRKPR
jgi:peptidoglycan/xylan/chitin deacetylase (PgdA/CDA1 family)